ncbi:MAG: DnaD domain protein [Chloroflexota bacterium]|nr:DnaD domain protein [Chloroflexota bacterium]
MVRKFGGFVVAAEPSVSVPSSFFTDVLPQISDMSELHAVLATFHLASLSGGIESPISQAALLRNRPLREALRTSGSPREPDRRIQIGLDLAVGRGTLLQFTADSLIWYYVNTPVNQALISAMSRGAVAPPMALWHDEQMPQITPDKPNVFRLYEQNIGVLTPLIADRLVTAIEAYSAQWIEDAIGEAVTYNRRSWRYVERILSQWSTTGRRDIADQFKDGSHETYRRRAERDAATVGSSRRRSTHKP